MKSHTPKVAGLNEVIAVVGLSFKFSGDATSPDSFWDMLLRGECTAAKVPADRFNVDAFYHPDTRRLDTLPVKEGSFVKHDISAFDAPFFSARATEAAAMDPQSRALLETTYRALENAGIPYEKAAGSKTCVFTGISADDYRLMYYKDVDRPIQYAATGMTISMLANKISWFYDFRGPSVQLDTACSASLNALHLACRSLRLGESDMGVVGGANLCFSPENMSPLAHLNFFSPDGRCYSFDHRANGYSRGEGFGVLVLKRLSTAVADGDTIRAVIRATGSNENGRTVGGITKANSEAQKNLILDTYSRAGLNLDSTRYAEAHGPGTEGDYFESAALASAFNPYRSKKDPLFMGSIKANLGHLEGASGIASLVKTILILERGVIPKLTNFEKLHPKIEAEDWNMKFPTRNTLFPEGLRRVSINSFGFGGSNAHAVLDDAYHCLREFGLEGKHATSLKQATDSFETDGSGQDRICGLSACSQSSSPVVLDRDVDAQPKLLVWSAADENGISRLAKAYIEHFTRLESHRRTYDSLQNLAYTLSERRSSLPWKSFLIARSTDDARENLADSISKPIRSPSDVKIVLVFTGQGAQYAQMGRGLLSNAVFRRSLNDSQTCLSNLGCPWDLFEELSKDEDRSNIHDPAFAQPLCTILQIGLAEMLKNFGVRPVAVIGHSSGEIAAAFCSGALSQTSAVRVAYFRGLLASRLVRVQKNGGMLAVALSHEDAQNHILQLKESGRPKVEIACVNSPKSVTLAGDTNQLDILQGQFSAKSIFARRLKVGVAYHSSHMRAIAVEYETALEQLSGGAFDSCWPQMYSSVTAQHATAGELLSPRYWVDNMLSTVQFFPGLQCLVDDIRRTGNTTNSNENLVLLELGSHPALRGPIREVLQVVPKSSTIQHISTLNRGKSDLNSILGTLGQIHCLGYDLNFSAINGYKNGDSYPMCLENLPEYPFDHSKTYWHESRLAKAHRFRKYARHDLLGSRVFDWNPLEARWRNIIRTLENPWIEDHNIGGALIYPGAGMLVMAIEALGQYIRDIDERQIIGFMFKDVRFLTSLKLSLQPEGVETEAELTPIIEASRKSSLAESWFNFCVHMLDNGEWVEVCRARVTADFGDNHNSSEMAHEFGHINAAHKQTFREQTQKCTIPLSSAKLYRGFHSFGLELGPTFQVFEDTTYNPAGGMAAAKIKLSNWLLRGNLKHSSPHVIHPTALDGVLQLTVVALGNGVSKTVPTMVPSRIKSMWISTHNMGSEANISSISAVAQAEYRGFRSTESAALAVDAISGDLKIIVEGLETIVIANESTSQNHAKQLCYDMKWLPDVDTLDRADLESYCRQAAVGDYENYISLESQGSVLSNSVELGPLSAYIKAATHKNPEMKFLEIPSENASSESGLMLWPILHELNGEKHFWSANFQGYDIGFLDAEPLRATEETLIQSAGDSRVSVRNLNSNTLDCGDYDISYDLLMDSTGLKVFDLTELKIFDSILERAKSLLNPAGKLVVFAKDLAEASFGDRSNWKFLSKVKLSEDADVNMFILELDDLPVPTIHPHRFRIVNLGPEAQSQQQLSKRLSKALCLQGPGRTGASYTELVHFEDVLSQNSADKDSLDPFYIFVCEWESEFLSRLDSVTFEIVLSQSGIMWITARHSKSLDVLPQDAITGLARSVRAERPAKKFVTLNFELDGLVGEKFYSSAVRTIVNALHQTISAPVPTLDTEYVCRQIGNDSYGLCTPRLQRAHDLNAYLNTATDPSNIIKSPWVSSSHPPLNLTMTSPGLLDTLVFNTDPTAVAPLAPHEVLIEPQYVGLNFLDLLTALGRIPTASTLGIEAAGTVLAAGTATDLVPGDRVGVLTDGTLRNHIRAHYMTAIKIPDELSFADAASSLNSACTAYRSLVELAAIQPGEKVLIHAGAGATGQMAVQIALCYGATVYVTVGSEKKKKLVCETYGIPETHVFHSRDASFALAVKRMTHGVGVDVVLNSLSGDLLDVLWEDCVAPFGRWVELGKMDIFEARPLNMRTFLRNVTFTCVDLSGIWREQPQTMRRILTKTLDLFKQQKIGVMRPIKTFNVADIESALRAMQNNVEGGKIIIHMDPSAEIKILTYNIPSWTFEHQKSFIIAGGLGGLGRAVARWMVKKGARNLILISRGGADNPDKKALVGELTSQGCNVRLLQCDITDKAGLESALATCSVTMPPIKGCIQATMVLRDMYFDDMSFSEWRSCISPKVHGSWNLHTLLPKQMDFFIFFSSLSGIIGGVGQTNYAAGNTFQDGLARHRVSIGEKAVSLDLGMMISEGVIAEDEKLARALETTGFYQPMTTQELTCLLEKFCDPALGLLKADDSQIVCGAELPATRQARGIPEPKWMLQPLFRPLHMLQGTGDSFIDPNKESTVDFKTLLESAPSIQEAGAIITEELVHKISVSLAIPEPDVDHHRPLHFYGVDSLVAVELRNWFAKEIRADIAVFDILGNISLEGLCLFAASKSAYKTCFGEVNN